MALPIAGPAKEVRGEARVVPLYVCGGCRPEPLPYAMITLGDGLDELVLCPVREVCAWYAGHDLGGASEYTDHPETAILPAKFRQRPYFSCPNFQEAE